MTLFWNERGRVACAKHAPGKGTDTWKWERWRRIATAELAVAHAYAVDLGSMNGVPDPGLRCESCHPYVEDEA